jgi:hypothetical protein
MDALATIEAANRFDTETPATDFVTHPVATVTLDEALLAPSRSPIASHSSSLTPRGTNLRCSEEA